MRTLRVGILIAALAVSLTSQTQAFFNDYARISGFKLVEGNKIKLSVQLKKGRTDQTLISLGDLGALMTFFKVKEARQLIGKGFAVAMIMTKNTPSEVVFEGGKDAWKANLWDLIRRGRAKRNK